MLVTHSNPVKRVLSWSRSSAHLARLICAATLCASLSLGFVVAAAAPQAKPSAKPRPHAAVKPAAKHAAARPAGAAPPSQLEQLARALHEKPTDALYAQLSQFAARNAKTDQGTRAALALGYYDFNRDRYDEARKWLEKAAADPLLAEYALYWRAETDRSDGDYETALDEFARFRSQYPSSVMTESAVNALAQTALAADRPEVAVAALDGYPGTTNKAALVYLRAQAREKVAVARGDKPFAATTDYLDVVNRFPLGEEAKFAVARIPALQDALGDQFPGTPLTTEIARAEAFYDARRWADLRTAYRALMPKLSGAARERAVLRLAQADAQTTAGAAALSSLEITDPALDAERLYTLSQSHRSAKTESEMLASIEKLATQYPQSPWTEQALFAAGNYYWVLLDRDKAAEYYQRAASSFPQGPNASSARWRVVWTAYLERQDGIAGRLEQYIQQYPTSSYLVDALYWLGRANERAGNLARARTIYLAAEQRFPQTYFGQRAMERLRDVGREPASPAEFLAVIPPASRLDSFTDPLPETAAQIWSRAQALRTIAFDSSAELELRAGYTATRAPQLLLGVAEAAVAAGHFAAGIMTMRQIVPQMEARRLEEVPDAVWQAGFPLPYRMALENEAQRNRVDPMLVAGLIRQESAFAAEAVSRAGAVGLMQMMPPTGSQMARRLNVRFSRARLFDPEYNLQLGSRYISGLLMAYPAPEFALAAFNAGEDRVTAWTEGQKFEETPEFVESIPFTETRDYVQTVLRNAELYRQIYNRPAAVSSAAAAPLKP